MSITLSIFLYIYFAFLFVWLILSLVAIYHMLKFGFKSFATFSATFIFIVISIFLLLGSYTYLSQIDWQKEIIIFDVSTNTQFNIK
jgi:hypothetical protein